MLGLFYLLIEGAVTLVFLSVTIYLMHIIFDKKWKKEK